MERLIQCLEKNPHAIKVEKDKYGDPICYKFNVDGRYLTLFNALLTTEKDFNNNKSKIYLSTFFGLFIPLYELFYSKYIIIDDKTDDYIKVPKNVVKRILALKGFTKLDATFVGVNPNKMTNDINHFDYLK